MKSAAKTNKTRFILLSLILLLYVAFGGVFGSMHASAMQGDVFPHPVQDTSPVQQNSFFGSVSVPFVLTEEAHARRLLFHRLFPTSENNKKDKWDNTFISMPFSRTEGNVMRGFGTWHHAFSRRRPVFARHIIITYIHLQDGLK